ncbi:MAG TPA: putative toxin-antitoxin system toxin component, PIN family [Anaerolineae bacterium]|nr:putative toxin-antitoxin system toxin component, PIN family [Anaerolineae bacterium]
MSIRAVLDTNVLVSGLISEHSPPRQLVDAWLAGSYRLVTSLYQVEELNHVLAYPRLANRLRLMDAEVDLILTALLSEAEVVAGNLQLPGVTRDPKDDPLLAAAVEGRADYLVSGDRDLLDLGSYQGIQMVTPREFVEILNLGAATQISEVLETSEVVL